MTTINPAEFQYISTELIWPMIAPLCGGGNLITVEGKDDAAFQEKLDTVAGIDAWQYVPHQQAMRGVALRVQPCPQSWDTFTIRGALASGRKTEYAKRLEALTREGDWLYPAITIQAYVSTDLRTLLAAAVVRTADLYGFVGADAMAAEGQRGSYVKNVHGSGTRFIVVPWTALRTGGVKLGVVRGEN